MSNANESNADKWDTRSPEGAGRSLQELRHNVDYLYCAECGHHVSCIRLERGVWEVRCPRCAGECGLCGCNRRGHCLGKNNVPVQTHMYVADEGEG